MREAIDALDLAGVDAPEIHRRLEADEAGLGYAIKISRRQVYYHRSEARLKRDVDTDPLAESIDAQRERIRKIIAREIGSLEKKKAGTLTVTESRALAEHYKSLRRIETDEKIIAQSKTGKRANGSAEPDEEPEDIWEKLAREERAAEEEAFEDPRPQAPQQPEPERASPPTPEQIAEEAMAAGRAAMAQQGTG